MRAITKGLLAAGAAVAGAAWVSQYALRRARWFDFAGKVVLVTGGSRGLGLILARKLVAAGARVAICARSEADVRAAVDELCNGQDSVLGLVCDIRSPHQVEQMVKLIEDRWQRIDVLFNVAGIIEVGPLDSMTLDDFHEAMDINCWGALHTTLAVLPLMRRQGWGRMVNVASIGGKQAVPHLLPYDMSKFALVGLSTGLRTELAQENILVTTVSPTIMRTGSPRNAIFKGQHRGEYAWFSIGSGTPFVSVSAERAADQILLACQRGDADVFISNWFNPPVLAAKFAPTLTTEVLSLINAFLPGMGGIGRRRARGHQSHSSVSPSPLTALSDAAARENNEMRSRQADPAPSRAGIAAACDSP